ncbi:hypothetical protein BJ085DRAFT_27444 [Dimargaris cristalligena]|uniref:Uncharacterized protein n=1 Tax=Dimargaris cristalligena TaxID=215637 RepID=A0A4V1J5G5_9FUNG|nr:hypothetical protein BJ085DRAFT_27444 [Dimargaris cristalligena]|eukprot:RKP38979.1 hypothetical protein BJ085DRAFT_27444 [Dimargaris cristalligena]
MNPFRSQLINHLNPCAMDALPRDQRAPGMTTHAEYHPRMATANTTPPTGRLPSQSTLVCTPVGNDRALSTKWTSQVGGPAVVHHNHPFYHHGLPVTEFPPILSGVPTEPSSFNDEYEFDSDYLLSHYSPQHNHWPPPPTSYDLIPDDGKDDTDDDEDEEEDADDADFFQRLPIDPIPIDIQNRTCSLLHLALQDGGSDAHKLGGNTNDEELDEMDAFHTPRNNLALSYYFRAGTYNPDLAPQHRVCHPTTTVSTTTTTTSSSSSSSSPPSTHSSSSTTTTTSMFDAALQEEIDRANYYSHRSTVLRLFGFNPDFPYESIHQSLNADFIRTML